MPSNIFGYHMSSHLLSSDMRLQTLLVALYYERPFNMLYMVRFGNPIRDCGPELHSNLFLFMCSFSRKNRHFQICYQAYCAYVTKRIVLSFLSLYDCVTMTLRAAVNVNLAKPPGPTITTPLIFELHIFDIRSI